MQSWSFLGNSNSFLRLLFFFSDATHKLVKRHQASLLRYRFLRWIVWSQVISYINCLEVLWLLRVLRQSIEVWKICPFLVCLLYFLHYFYLFRCNWWFFTPVNGSEIYSSMRFHTRRYSSSFIKGIVLSWKIVFCFNTPEISIWIIKIYKILW